MIEQKKPTDRLAFLDWMRGLGAFIMLQGHSFDSLIKPELRNSSAFVLSQFVGGIAPAIFLFLTGITFAFLMDSQSRQQPSAPKRVWRALNRSGYLFLLAFLFRLQLFAFGYPNSPAGDLVKVDILNCMGMAMAIFAPMAVFTTKERIRLCVVLGVLVAALSPLVTIAGSNSLPVLAKAYFVPSYNYFGFFPWAAFLAFGMAAGSVLRAVGKEELQRTMQWAMLLGIRVGHGRPVRLEPALFDLYEIGVLAGQSRPYGDQAGRAADDRCHRLFVGDHGRVALEFVSPARAHLATGLLGPY